MIKQTEGKETMNKKFEKLNKAFEEVFSNLKTIAEELDSLGFLIVSPNEKTQDFNILEGASTFYLKILEGMGSVQSEVEEAKSRAVDLSWIKEDSLPSAFSYFERLTPKIKYRDPSYAF